jgi:septal ring factor EnvC (AmiA/AmiB activator)
MEKEALRVTYMKDIQAQRKVTEKQDKEFQKVVEKGQKEIEELQEANKRLRSTLERLPRQMAEVVESNESLSQANEEIAGHFQELLKFSKKLQGDHDRLLASSSTCKDEYLPRYRQELWERQQYLNAETKIKNLYRDCMIKISKRVDQSKQVALIEEIANLTLETEGEVNPNFDPNVLFAPDKKGSSSSDSDSDSDSDSSSDSDSD